jgi:phytanoyl-CoA hydroxylase
MITDVTPEQVATYQAQGFIVLDNFLTPAELEHWREVTADAIRVRLANSQNLSNQGDPDAFYAQVFTQCLRLADIHPSMAELIFDERLGRLVGTLAGVDGIRIWHDQALVKPPYGNHTAFHCDNPFWSFSSPNAISIWVALDDATLANGCLWYLPGTHLQATYDSTGIGENLGGLFKVYPQWKQLKALPADCRAGSAVCHNGLIAHGAGANMTPYPRRAMTCAFMPDGSTFNGKKNILPDDYYASLKVGDLLDNEQINRLTWRREGLRQPAAA